MAGNIAEMFDHALITSRYRDITSQHTISNERRREDRSNLRHGAVVPVAGGFAELPVYEHIRKADTQQDAQDS